MTDNKDKIELIKLVERKGFIYGLIGDIDTMDILKDQGKLMAILAVIKKEDAYNAINTFKGILRQSLEKITIELLEEESKYNVIKKL